MRALMARRLPRVGVAGGVCALTFAALVSVGAAVSPSGTSAVSAQYPEKVTICHRTHSKKNPFVTIRVSQNALKAHLKHFDAIGPCPTAKFTICDITKKGKAQKTVKVKGAKKAAKHLRNGDTLGKCKPAKKNKKQIGEQGAKGSEKNKEKGKSSENPGKSGEKGKPAETPGNPGKSGEKGKPAETPGK
jgi:hypothetical protein